MKNRIFSLRKWLSLADAITYLSNELDENVEAHDIFSLAMDKRLTLAVRFQTPVHLKVGSICGTTEEEINGGRYLGPYDDFGYIKVNNSLIYEDEVFEMPYFAGCWEIIKRLERSSLNNQYCYINEFEDACFHEIVLKRPNGEYVILQEAYKDPKDGLMRCQSACCFSATCRLFVSAEGLKSLILQLKRVKQEGLLENNSSKPFARREKNSMLRTIAGLLLVLQSKGMSEAQAIKWLDEQGYSDMEGLSKSTLEARFAEAKRAI